jgi:mRNA interferase RelE/StbE
MELSIIWSDRAKRQLGKLDRGVARRIFEHVGGLKNNPHRQVQKLVNSRYFRLRVGDYRVFLDIQGATLRILVLKVGHRGTIYR